MAARRSLVVFAGLALGPVPACLHISGNVTPPPEPPAPKREFAVLPSRPGEVVRAHPDAKPPADPPPTVTRRPAPEPEEPVGPPAAEVTAVRAEPAALPTLTPKPVAEPPLLAAMRAYAEGRPYDAFHHLDGLDPPNQELVLQLLPPLVRLAQLNLSSADPHEVGVMADQYHAVAGRLDAKAALAVETVAFCRDASGFGKYTPRPLTEPYKPYDRTYLYVELKHVACEPAAGPNGEGFVTRVRVAMEVRNSSGQLVEQTDSKDPRRKITAVAFDHTGRTRAAVRDYHQTYAIFVPPQPGVYTITVEARDLTTSRVARSRPVEFRVAGQ